MLCALRLLGRSKFTQIHKVDCHLPPCRAAVAGLEGGYIYVFSFIIYFNCYRQLTYKHPFRTPRPLETHTSARHHKSACQPPHHKGAEQIEKPYCSNRSASTGFILAAFLAGTIPEITPTSVENTRAKIINCGETTVFIAPPGPNI